MKKLLFALLLLSGGAIAGGPVLPLHKEAAPKTAVFINYVQATARSMDAACEEMAKKAKKIGATAVYNLTANGSSIGIRSTYICYGDAVK